MVGHARMQLTLISFIDFDIIAIILQECLRWLR
jgi:hypothetical protein